MNEDRFLSEFRKGLLEVFQPDRVHHWRRCFGEAAKVNADCWACLFKAMELLASGEDDDVIELLRTAQRFGDYTHGYGDPFILAVILARADFYRRLARRSYAYLNYYEQRFGAYDREDHLSSLKSSIEAARKIYDEIVAPTKKAPAEYTIVALYKLGDLERYGSFFEGLILRSRERNSDWEAQLTREEKWFRQSAKLAEKSHVAFPLPLARISSLYIERWARLSEVERRGEVGKNALGTSLEYSADAIAHMADGKIHPRALLDSAFAKFQLAALGPGEHPLRAAQPDLDKVLKQAPFDPAVRRNYESYLAALAEGLPEMPTLREYLRAALVRPFQAVNRYLGKVVAEWANPVIRRANRDTLLIVKRWSSYSPAIIREEGRKTSGGGYLLNWRNYWIAIDPGMGFIDQMYHFGVSPAALSAIIITHDHTDHQQDMQPLLALIKEACDRFGRAGGAKQDIHVLLSQSGFERWPAGRFPKVEGRRWVRRQLDPAGPAASLNKGLIRVKATRTYGHKDIGDIANGRKTGTGIGFILELRDKPRAQIVRSIGISGDSAYHQEGEEYLSSQFDQCDLVVAHISTIADLAATEPDELIEPTNRPLYLPRWFKGFHKKHLGFWGTVSMIRDLEANEAWMRKRGRRLLLISEFGEEFLSIRRAVSRELVLSAATEDEARRLSERIACLPADIGTRVSIRRNRVLCQFGKVCPRAAEDEDNEGSTGPFERVVGEDNPFPAQGRWRERELLYLCKEHSWIREWPAYREVC